MRKEEAPVVRVFIDWDKRKTRPAQLVRGLNETPNTTRLVL